MPPILSHSRVTAPGAEPSRWLMVLHGIYGSGRNWATLARSLVGERPEWGVLLPDLRLHGASAGFEPPHTLAAAAADVEALVEALGLPLAVVLGHSFGGKVSLAYARHHPERLEQVWVVDSTLEVREPSGSAWRVLEAVRSLPERLPSREALAEGLAPFGYERPMASWLAMNLERDGDFFRWRLDWDGVEALLRDYFAVDLWDVVEDPPGSLEVHVVKATDSNSLRPEDVQRVEAAGERTGRTFLHPVDGGHWINVDNPAGMLERLLEHLPPGTASATNAP